MIFGALGIDDTSYSTTKDTTNISFWQEVMLKSCVPHNRLAIEKRFPWFGIVTGGAVDFEIIKLHTGKLY